MTRGALGRLEPQDWRHIELYPFEAAAPVAVERVLRLPRWRAGRYAHDQGREGSCVGHAVALERAIANGAETHRTRRYDPITVWRAAKEIDEYPQTHAGDNNGTSVRAAYEIARTKGLRPVRAMELVAGVPTPIELADWQSSAGVTEYRWARTVDDVRAAIALGAPVAIGVNWYSGFDTPTRRAGEDWIDASALGRIRGGHSVALYGASDRRQAFRLCNSWGRSYPLVWLPYAVLERLLAESGEAALVTDRLGG